MDHSFVNKYLGYVASTTVTFLKQAETVDIAISQHQNQKRSHRYLG